MADIFLTFKLRVEAWASEGGQGPSPPLDFEIISKKGSFSI